MYHYKLEMSVRDYECDLQGIVNNSVYQNYLEHARHEFLKTIGLDFVQLFKDGIVAVVARVDLAYKTPLRSGDKFEVRLRLEKKGIKYLFYQDIYKLPDNKISLKGVITTVTLINNKLSESDVISNALNKFMS